MNLKKLFADDDAVSPVIGVILMVAITVILAAVIASFVLGLGDNADSVQPNSSFSFDTEPGDGTNGGSMTITLTDGDTVEANEIVLRGDVGEFDEGSCSVGDNIHCEGSGSSSDDISKSDTWDVGQNVGLDLPATHSAGTLRLVWEEIDGDNSATLAETEFPANS